MGKLTKVVSLPNSVIIKASHTTNSPFPSLSAKARQADVLPGLRHNSLISIGKFADASYTTVFYPHGKGVTVHQPVTFKVKLLHKPVLRGGRDTNGLWQMPRVPPRTTTRTSGKQQEVASNDPQTIIYLHATAGFPIKDSWVKAIKNGHYVLWPGLSAEAVGKHFPESVETQKEHMKKQSQNVRSTKQKIAVADKADVELTRTIAKQNILVKVIKAHEMVYSDQTGWLPVQSNKGNRLLMLYYDVNAS
jgi:hypothetical protein